MLRGRGKSSKFSYVCSALTVPHFLLHCFHGITIYQCCRERRKYAILLTFPHHNSIPVFNYQTDLIAPSAVEERNGEDRTREYGKVRGWNRFGEWSITRMEMVLTGDDGSFVRDSRFQTKINMFTYSNPTLDSDSLTSFPEADSTTSMHPAILIWSAMMLQWIYSLC